jgi:hypothetical protein
MSHGWSVSPSTPAPPRPLLALELPLLAAPHTPEVKLT